MKDNKEYTICIAGHHYYKEKQGGVELQTRYIGETLAQSGWKVVFLAPSLNGKNGQEEINENIHVWWYTHFSFVFQVPTALIEQMLDTIRPNVFYQRGRSTLLESRVVLNYARKRHIPYVFALSTDKDLDELYGIKMNLKAYKPLWKRIVLLPYSWWLDRSRKQVLKDANYLVVQHEGQAKKVREKLRRNPYILRTIHPELNREIHKSDLNIVLWVNNYRPWKRGEVFVQLAESCKQLRCNFIMVYGRTKKEYIEPVLQEAKGKNNLTVLGEIPPQEVENLMEKAILFVNTSEPQEGFPNTFVQSWLRETPTISLDVNPGEVLIRKKIGICSGNFKQLVKDVRYLIKNDQVRIMMGKRGRAYAERVHGIKSNAKKIAEFFFNIVSERENNIHT